MPRRYIYDHELVFFTHGGGTYTIEDVLYTVNAGELHIIRPHQLNSCVLSPGYSLYFAAHFDLSPLKSHYHVSEQALMRATVQNMKKIAYHLAKLAG